MNSYDKTIVSGRLIKLEIVAVLLQPLCESDASHLKNQQCLLPFTFTTPRWARNMGSMRRWTLLVSKKRHHFQIKDILLFSVLGRGPFQNYVFLACGMSLMYVMAETLGVSYIIPPAKCDLELDTMRKGILSSVSVFGIALTSHVSGFLTDQLGRKRTVFMSIFMSTCLSAVSALVPGFWTMVLFRLMAGMR